VSGAGGGAERGLAVDLTVARPGFSLAAAFAAPGRGVTAIFGPSGAGKTTLLRAIAGLERGGGRVAVGGETWQDDARGVFLPTHRRALGMVFQEAALFEHRTVRGNLDYALARTPRQRRRVGFDEAAARLGLGRLLDRRPAGLSGGERQRVAIARALLRSPALHTFDEPLASLDAAARAEILPYLEDLHRELDIPVLYVSHARDEVLRLADHLVLLDGGRVTAAGPLADLAPRLALAGGDDAGTVAEATVVAHEEHALTRLDLGGLPVLLPRLDARPGESRLLRFLARDVSLALSPAADSSILNVLPARVEAIHPAGEAEVLVDLRLGADGGGPRLLSRITRRSLARLGIAAGSAVHVQIKAAALVR
jgi:molybdate transport system ATP-binding protein